MNHSQGKVSLPVIKRLPKYYRYISQMQQNGVVKVSSSELARMMGTTASQVRQDFNCFGGFGQQGIGYNVDVLLHEIGRLLFGEGEKLPTILVGAGRLGRAVSRFLTTDTNGYHLLAVFDVQQELVGQDLDGIPIHHIDELESFCAAHKPQVAVLCLPREGAKEISGRLVDLRDGGECPSGRQPDEPGLPAAERLNPIKQNSSPAACLRSRADFWRTGGPSLLRCMKRFVQHYGKIVFSLRRHEQRQKHRPDAGGL